MSAFKKSAAGQVALSSAVVEEIHKLVKMKLRQTIAQLESGNDEGDGLTFVSEENGSKKVKREGLFYKPGVKKEGGEPRKSLLGLDKLAAIKREQDGKKAVKSEEEPEDEEWELDGSKAKTVRFYAMNIDTSIITLKTHILL